MLFIFEPTSYPDPSLYLVMLFFSFGPLSQNWAEKIILYGPGLSDGPIMYVEDGIV